MAKTPANRNKKIFYFRAQFGRLEGDQNLQNLLKLAIGELPTAGDRTFIATRGALHQCSNFDSGFNDFDGLFMQVTSFTPGEAASVIESKKDKPLTRVDSQDAPDGKDFVDGEAFILVKNNHVLFCLSTARETLVKKYLPDLLINSLFVREGENLQLLPVANQDKMKMIAREGIKELELNATMYEASLAAQNRDRVIDGPTDILASIAHKFKAALALDDDLNDIDERENLNVKLAISFDGSEARLKENKQIDGFGDAGKEHLQELSKLLVIDDDAPEYRLVTNNNNIITPNDVKVSDNKKIDTLGKSLSKQSAWQTLLFYYNELENAGILEE